MKCRFKLNILFCNLLFKILLYISHTEYINYLLLCNKLAPNVVCSKQQTLPISQFLRTWETPELEVLIPDLSGSCHEGKMAAKLCHLETDMDVRTHSQDLTPSPSRSLHTGCFMIQLLTLFRVNARYLRTQDQKYHLFFHSLFCHIAQFWWSGEGRQHKSLSAGSEKHWWPSWIPNTYVCVCDYTHLQQLSF